MVKIHISFILILSLLNLIYAQEDEKIKPVIGIYGNPDPENNDTFVNGTYYPVQYIYWLESAGAEVMAIHYWYDLDVIDELLNKVNGVLFLGGGRDFIKEGVWEQKAKFIMDQSLIYHLPIWATCQGFQLMGIIMSDNYTFLRYGFNDSNVMHGVEFTEYTKSSIMYNLFTKKDYEILQNGESTIYNHHYGFYPEEFYREERLNELFVVTTISEDLDGLKFINSFEGKNDSIKLFATQFHPEKNPYKRYNYIVEQNIDSLIVSQKLAMAFVEEARKNKNRFDSTSNDKGDRAKFDFFDTIRGTPNSRFDKKSETFYFSKKEK